MPGIKIERQNEVLLVTLCYPEKANALSREMVAGIRESISQATQESCAAIVFQGEGRHFCAGFDLDVDGGSDLCTRFLELEEMLSEVAYAPMPTIACVHGATIGAGADLAVACTFRVGTFDTVFRFPGPQFGVALGTRRLANLVGPHWSYKLLLLQATMGSEDALRNGLLSSIVETQDELLSSGIELTRQLRLIDSATQRRILRIVRSGNSAEDMGELAESISRLGLHDRIAEYAKRRKGGSSASPQYSH